MEWEWIHLVRCALCWKQGIPEQAGAFGLRRDGFQQRGADDGSRCQHWFCPMCVQAVDRHVASDGRLIGGAGI